MSVRERLARMQELEQMLSQKCERCMLLRSAAFDVSISGSGDRVQSSPDPDRLGCAMVKITETEQEIESLEAELTVIKGDIAHLLDYHSNRTGDKRESLLVYHKYFGHMTLYQIAQEWGMRYDTVKKMYRRAIEALEESEKELICCENTKNIV